MEEDMRKMHLAAGIAASVLMTASAMAQTNSTGTQTQGATAQAGAGQVMTQMPANLMRGSQLMGIDVYGSDNQKIGDVDEVLVDRQGKIHGLVVGVGGFLGIGEKSVAIPFDQIQWMTSREVQAASGNQGGTTNTAGGTTTAGAPATTMGQPATTGSTGTAGTTGAGGTMGGTAGSGMNAGTTTASGSGNDENMPARAMVRMSKADLQNAPEFRYNTNDGNRTNASGGNTNPPPANRPATAPQ
jgi:sporulation protein YlmC with PRC-barrel domain